MNDDKLVLSNAMRRPQIEEKRLLGSFSVCSRFVVGSSRWHVDFFRWAGFFVQCLRRFSVGSDVLDLLTIMFLL